MKDAGKKVSLGMMVFGGLFIAVFVPLYISWAGATAKAEVVYSIIGAGFGIAYIPTPVSIAKIIDSVKGNGQPAGDPKDGK